MNYNKELPGTVYSFEETKPSGVLRVEDWMFFQPPGKNLDISLMAHYNDLESNCGWEGSVGKGG